MADDGGWHGGSGIELSHPSDDTRVRFQLVLSEFAHGLASPTPMRRETAVSIVQQLDRLGRRMAAEQETALARATELDAALVALTARLEAASAAGAAREAELTTRIDRLLVELTEARSARRPVPVRTILAAVAACTALGGAVAGIAGLSRQPVQPRGELAVVPAIVEPIEALPAPMPAPTPTDAPAAAPRVATVPSQPSPPAVAADPARRDTYPSVMRALSRGDADAILRLTGLAAGGDAKAQLRLALAYETADHGLPQDLTAARLWTLRAATGGDPVAMYNAGQFLMGGDGGPKDPAGAASWFRRAAQLGVVDAQYNLGLMYETGHGVERSPREALRWYALAGKAGDATARQKQATLEREFGASARSATSPVAADDLGTPDAGVPGASVSETQAYLAQQGYYIGPIDGLVTPQLREAANAYMKDRPAIVPGRQP